MQWGSQVVLDRVVVVVRVCLLRVAPWHCWERYQGLVMLVGLSVVHAMVWCGLLRRVGCVSCQPYLCWGVVVKELSVVAPVLGQRGAGVGGGGGALMPVMVPCSLALREWRALCGLNLCGQRSLCGVRRAVLVQGWGAAVRRCRSALRGVLLVECSGALEMGWCDAVRPRSWSGYRPLLAGALAGTLARFHLLGLAGLRGRWSLLSLWG